MNAARCERWLLVRNDNNQKVNYALSNAPQQTPLRELARVSGLRWPIERCFQEGKSIARSGLQINSEKSATDHEGRERCGSGASAARRLNTLPHPIHR